MSELKPCPFCGGEAEMHYGVISEDNTPHWYDASCKDEKCRGYATVCFSNTKEKAIEAWNRRVNDDH